MTSRIKKIALFLPQRTSFYINLFSAMKRGFEQAGFDVSGGLQLLDKEPMLEFCRQYKPGVVFEMNRSKAQIPWFPKNVIHIAWIVDLMGEPFSYFRDSDIIYLFGFKWVDQYIEAWKTQFGKTPPVFVKWLPPGYSPDVYFPASNGFKIDFSFVGHIPLPWTPKELSRDVPTKDGKTISFGDVYAQCIKVLNIPSPQAPTGNKLGDVLHNLVDFKDQKIKNDQSLRYDLNIRITRMLNRSSMMDCLKSTKRSIHIYGPENWKAWQEYKPYYKHFLIHQNDIRKVFVTSKINVHEGNGTHFRLFDEMGSGAFVFYHKNHFGSADPSGLEAIFEEGRHYVAFDKHNIKLKADHYSHHPEIRKKIAKEAFRIVYSKHKWSDRAQEILHDVKTL